jgi:diguanylate cyclase (GGDEF)-like protein/PAS domain S-box-containing protein
MVSVSEADAVVVDADDAELYEQAPCGYLTVRDDGTIIRVNDTFLTWAGYEREQLLGTRWQRLLPVGDRMLYSTHALPQLRLVGVSYENAIEIVAADGSRRPALYNASRVAAKGERPPLTRIIVFSARERRRYEKELLAALRRAEESDVQRRKAESELRHRESHDPVTDLPNRFGLVQQLTDALPSDSALAVCVIHLDQLEEVRDTLGRSAADMLVQVMVAKLQGSIRDSAILGRLTLDDLAIVDRVNHPDDGAKMAQRVLALTNEPITVDGIDIVTGATVGITVSSPLDDDPEAVLRRADVAMYRAKARDRGGWQLHEYQPHPAVNRLRLLGDIRQGIKNEQFVLHYQPQYDARSGSMVGAEALVRWQHPGRGLLAPGDFIAVAEQSGLINELGAQLLDSAVAQAARWNAGRAAPLAISVNLSARQLIDPNLTTVIQESLERHGLPPSQLTLEVTETALMTDIAAAIDILAALQATGAQISIDDFGTGYSSFTYLKRLPVHELKIDQSFVSGLGTDAADTAIVASCIKLAHAVGKQCVAEGVETPLQRRLLTEMGCDLLQGFLLGRPVPPELLQG